VECIEAHKEEDLMEIWVEGHLEVMEVAPEWEVVDKK
jgi:hypothetical protein